MTLAFPNPSRRFDEGWNAVLFFGHALVFEIRFFVEAGTLAISGTALPIRKQCLFLLDCHDLAADWLELARRECDAGHS
jgi:hypothetical protein